MARPTADGAELGSSHFLRKPSGRSIMTRKTRRSIRRLVRAARRWLASYANGSTDRGRSRARLLALSAQAERAIDYDEEDEAVDPALGAGCTTLAGELRQWLDRPRTEPSSAPRTFCASRAGDRL